jgi:5-methyltetrahydrofolate--homocysteine methyltransferase
MELKELLTALAESVITGKPEDAVALVEQGLAANYDPLTMIEEGLRPGMNVAGERFETGDYFIIDLAMSGEAMKSAIAVLEPHLKESQQERERLGTVVIGTVEGDIHEIGKTLVAMMLTAAGFEVHDLGVDVSPEKFVEAVREKDADLVGMSALLTSTMLNQEAAIKALKEAGLREQVRVMIGGAPTGPDWAEEIEADAHAANATEAVRVARFLLGLD